MYVELLHPLTSLKHATLNKKYTYIILVAR